MKKGFTLIELLAVIVVLAILALVVTPIVLNIVENAQTGADERSLEQYAKVMQTAFYENQMNDTSLTLEEYLSRVDTESVSSVSLTYNGSKVICNEKRVGNKEDGIQTIELYGCTVDGRGPYNFVDGKAYKSEDFKITTNLTNATIDNPSVTIKNGEKYETGVNPKEGYEIEEIKVKMDGKDITSTSYKDGKITIEKVSGDIEIKVETIKKSYSIAKTLTNVNINNERTTIKHGENYSGTLTPTNSYSITTVKIEMNGEDITSTAYNDTNKTITIEKVTGNIEITASAEQTTFTVTNSLVEVTTNNSEEVVEKGTSYTAILTPTNLYSITIVKIEMNGEDITSSAYNNGNINIENVTGNIVITASAEQTTFTITKSLGSYVKLSNSTTQIEKGESYTATLTSSNNLCSITTVTVTMNGEDITSTAYSNGNINISNVTGNIKITAKSDQTAYNVTNSLTNVTTNNSATTAQKNGSYTATLTSTTEYGLDLVKVMMGSSDITTSAYSNGNINISNVTGDIKIIVMAPASQFGVDSWNTIVTNVQNGNTDIYNVGDIKTVDLGTTLGKHIVRVANKTNTGDVCTKEYYEIENEDGTKTQTEEKYSKTACGFVIEFVDIITNQKMNSTRTNAGGWPASSMRTYVNETIYNALPSELKNAIIDTTVVSGHGSTSGETNFTSTDKIYLLSTAEVWKNGASDDAARHLTRQLDYYENLGVTTSNKSGAIKSNNGSNADWWLQSASSNYTNSFYVVRSGGGSNNFYANSPGGVSPAFRIG